MSCLCYAHNMPTYEPGSVLRNSAGYPAIIHDGEGTGALCVLSHHFFQRVLDGEISMAEYAQVATNHVAIQLAHGRGTKLPLGAIVTYEPERLQGSSEL